MFIPVLFPVFFRTRGLTNPSSATKHAASHHSFSDTIVTRRMVFLGIMSSLYTRRSGTVSVSVGADSECAASGRLTLSTSDLLQVTKKSDVFRRGLARAAHRAARAASLPGWEAPELDGPGDSPAYVRMPCLSEA
jgi:hypothetical protein